MEKNIKKFLTLFCLIFVLLFPYFVFAQNPLEKLKGVGTAGGYADISNGETTILQTASGVVSIFLGLLGIIFIILIIYAGYNWMTAAGNEEKVKKAQETLKQAIIGLIIVVSAYAISFFVVSFLESRTMQSSLTPFINSEYI